MRTTSGRGPYRATAKILVPAALVALLLAPASRADLVFNVTVVHAGVVYSGNPLRQQFTFKNCGEQPVTIVEARASCGCMAPHLAKRTIQSGEIGQLELEINTLSQAAGPHTWRVRLEYRCGSQTLEAQVLLDAKLVTEVTVQPANMVLPVDRIAGHEFTITDYRSTPLQIIAIRASSPKVQPHLTESGQDAAGHWQRKISLVVAPDYPSGVHQETLSIFTKDPEYPEIRVPFTLLNLPAQRVTATPSEAVITGNSGQPLPSRIVLLRDRDNQNVVVESVTTDDPAVSCRWAQGPGTLATLRVQVDHKTVPAGMFESALHVRINKPVTDTLVIPIKCQIK